MNGKSAADSDAANPPAIAVPEPLPLPDAAAIIIIGDIARTVIAVAGSRVVAGAIIARGGQRAADDGAADHAGSQTGAETALGVSGGRYG